MTMRPGQALNPAEHRGLDQHALRRNVPAVDVLKQVYHRGYDFDDPKTDIVLNWE